MQKGTPQGSVISPTLFNIMVNDINKGDNTTKIAMYADDCVLWKSGKNLKHITKSAQSSLDHLYSWTKDWGITISTKKTVAIHFRKGNNHIARPELKVNSTIVPFVNSHMFLGITFQSTLSWIEHVNNLTQRCNKHLNIMKAVTGQDWGANEAVLTIMYKTLVRATLDYGSHLLSNASQTTLNKLEAIQKRGLRIITGALFLLNSSGRPSGRNGNTPHFNYTEKLSA